MHFLGPCLSFKKNYTYVNHSLQHKSCIDHFIVTKNIFDPIIGNMVLFETTINPSNHNGIQLTITCFDNAIYSQSNRLQSDRKPNLACHKATDANYKAYKSNLDQQLIAIEQNVDLYYCYNYN